MRPRPVTQTEFTATAVPDRFNLRNNLICPYCRKVSEKTHKAAYQRPGAFELRCDGCQATYFFMAVQRVEYSTWQKQGEKPKPSSTLAASTHTGDGG